MGKIWMPGGGGGADLDMVTVTDSSDVIAGKVIVDKEGNTLTGTLALSGNATDGQVLSGQTYYNSDPKNKRTGTMPNRGAVNQALGINGTYAIPEGYHNGSGKVTQNIATMAGQTITPGATQQTIFCNGKYMTGNITINGVRTYASVSRTVTSSTSMRTFNGLNSGDPNLSAYYVTISNIGFTPIFVSLVGEYKPGNPLHVAIDSWGLSYNLRTANSSTSFDANAFWLKVENISSNTIILPAGDYAGGKSFLFQAFGYY